MRQRNYAAPFHRTAARKTAAYLRFLTEERYRDVTVDDNMEMMVQLAGDSMKRKAEYMSGGAMTKSTSLCVGPLPIL